MGRFIDVDARMFAAVSQCASSDETRSYLCGVRIQRHPVKGALLVATDGHRLVAAHDESAHCKKDTTIALPKDALRLCLKKGDPLRLAVRSDGIAQIGEEWQSPATCLVLGAYPEWHRVVPLVKNWPNATASFRGIYIGDFGKIAEMFSGAGHGAIRVFTQSEMDPALILFPRIPYAFGVLMPMRGDVGEGVPLWMKPVIDQAKRPVKKRRVAKSKPKMKPKRKRAA